MTTVNSEKVRFVYLRPSYQASSRGAPFGCVAVSQVDKETVKYQFSICNPADTFNREHARNICMARLSKSPITLKVDCSEMTNPNHHGVMYAVLSALKEDRKTSRRIVKSVKEWMKNFNQMQAVKKSGV